MRENGSAGRAITYRDADKKTWVVWSFEHGSFADEHKKYFIVKASGTDAESLNTWWRTHPI